METLNESWEQGEYMNGLDVAIKRTEWFREARFGMFIHWGLYAIPARGEWVMSEERIPVKEYENYFKEFNPNDFDPRKWARAAKDAGMKYVVLTAKHHDGFCLFDTALTDYKSTNTPLKRDIVKEFLDAVRAEGLKAGLYFSIIDWHHEDYPKYADAFHPMRGNEEFRDETIDFDRYLRFMHGQVEELVTNYGKLDILWFDFSYDDMRGEKWKAQELIEMVRRHQPDVIVDNRLETSGEGFGSLVEKEISSYCGDFVSPEQIIPPEGVVNFEGKPVPWELCCTVNNHWCYNPRDVLYKSSSLLIRKLVECVSKGGNMLLGVGPDANGRMDAKSLAVIQEIGSWLRINGEAVYGCGNAGIPKPEWGRYTRKGNKVYAHVYEQPIGPLALMGLPVDRIKTIRRLSDGTEVKRGESWLTSSFKEIPFACLGEIAHFSYPLPDEADTVLEITLD